MAIAFDDGAGDDLARPPRTGRPARRTAPARPAGPTRRHGEPSSGGAPTPAKVPVAKRRSSRPRPPAAPERRRGDAAPAEPVLPARPLRSLRPQRPAPPAPEERAAPAPEAPARATPAVRRAAPMRTRAHGGAARRTTVWPRHHDQPMVRITAGVVLGPLQPLAIVPRRRRVSRLIAVGFGVIFALMLVAAAFQTQLAGRQVRLDKVERAIRDANQQYNDLRRQRSELRSPERLATAAAALGMRPATSTDFVTIDPSIVAAVQQSAGGVFDPNAAQLDSLDEFSRVKAIAGAAP